MSARSIARNAVPGMGAPAKLGRMGSASTRSLRYATSPLLASKTPPWRSRFVVAMVALGFAVLFGRAVWLQILHTDFYQAQGEKRFVQTQAVPALRGRILDAVSGAPLVGAAVAATTTGASAGGGSAATGAGDGAAAAGEAARS